MSRIIRAAAVQIAPDFENVDGTLNRVCAAIDEAGAKGVQLIVFPETFLPYYPYFSFVQPPVLQGPAQPGADDRREDSATARSAHDEGASGVSAVAA